MSDRDTKSGDDIRPIGAMICAGAGIWLLCEGLSMGGTWRIGGGFLFIVLGLVRGWYLLKESSGTQP
jgi:hypothetical protein